VKVPADFYKIVSTATTLYDNVTMMKFMEKFGDRHSLVALCMGEQGIISRLLGVRAGSVFTFAAVSPDEKTAPGSGDRTGVAQHVSHRTGGRGLRECYGVVGDPVAHSLSPAIMNASAAPGECEWRPSRTACQNAERSPECVRDIPIHGLSITMPYKEAILKPPR